MTTQIAKRDNLITNMPAIANHTDQLSLQDTIHLGDVFARSGFFSDSKDAAKAVVKILAGREVGLPPIAAMTGIYIVENKVTFAAQTMASIIKNSGTYNYLVRQHDNNVCRIEFFQGKQSLGISEFSMEDAQRAGLLDRKGSVWHKYPRNMMFARALSNGAKWHCPHLLNGSAYTPEEMGVNVTAEGEYIPPAEAFDDRHNAPLNGEQDFMNPGYDPVEPSPQRSKSNVIVPPEDLYQPEDVPMLPSDVPASDEYGDIWKTIHGEAAKSGLEHEDLHAIYNVESLKQLSLPEIENMPADLKTWRITDEHRDNFKKLAQIQEEWTHQATLGELRIAGKKWEEVIKTFSPVCRRLARKSYGDICRIIAEESADRVIANVQE